MYEYQNYIIRTTFCPFRTVTKSCPVETVPACPVQIRAHRHIAVYIDSNDKAWFREDTLTMLLAKARLKHLHTDNKKRYIDNYHKKVRKMRPPHSNIQIRRR